MIGLIIIKTDVIRKITLFNHPNQSFLLFCHVCKPIIIALSNNNQEKITAVVMDITYGKIIPLNPSNRNITPYILDDLLKVSSNSLLSNKLYLTI
ncbi:hypothetical protein MNB_SV-14-902 [hydrothermal vent metagenome]|uniref:Uncharacterized protein n=1 Tax=hydrothermal vent metagenome TaxID=652676 RepID=A0A1W1BJ40_9ZZZZ